MREYDREGTNPIIVEDELRYARGTQNAIKRPLGPALVGGDWMVSPSGVRGYIAGRSLDNPELWIFVIQTRQGESPSAVVEMTGDSFIGFKKVEV